MLSRESSVSVKENPDRKKGEFRTPKATKTEIFVSTTNDSQPF